MNKFKKFIFRPENTIFLMMIILTLVAFLVLINNILYYQASLIEFEEFKQEFEHIRTDDSAVAFAATPIYGFEYMFESLGNDLYSFFAIKVFSIIVLISLVTSIILRIIIIRKTNKTLIAYRIIASLYYLSAILVWGIFILFPIFAVGFGIIDKHTMLAIVVAVISAIFIVMCMKKTFSKKLAEVNENEKIS
ncbi:MAG: hypothetical protein IJA12_00855 [Oscillospiraceae bacterium]|nr:hypothetical protein [Oscillospiraceae bacterium]